MEPIKVVADIDNFQSQQVQASGQFYSIATDQQLEKFQLQTEKLKPIFTKYHEGSEHGAKCQDVWFRDPTGSKNYYKKYNWSEVGILFFPLRSQISCVQQKQFVAKETMLENNSDADIECTVGLEQTLTDRIFCSWSNSTAFQTGAEISATIKVPGGGIGGKVTTSITTTIGESKAVEQSVAIKSSDSVKVILKPHSKAIARLYATRAEATVNIDYNATVRGGIVNEFPCTIWKTPVENIMGYMRIPTMIELSQSFVVPFYFNSKIVVSNEAGNLIQSFRNEPCIQLENVLV